MYLEPYQIYVMEPFTCETSYNSAGILSSITGSKKGLQNSSYADANLHITSRQISSKRKGSTMRLQFSIYVHILSNVSLM